MYQLGITHLYIVCNAGLIRTSQSILLPSFDTQTVPDVCQVLHVKYFI